MEDEFQIYHRKELSVFLSYHGLWGHQGLCHVLHFCLSCRDALL